MFIEQITKIKTAFSVLFFISFFQIISLSANQNPDSFQVKDIRVEGLIRTSLSQVLSSINLKVEDEFNSNTSKKIIENLFQTNLFEDVIVGVDNDIVVISVIERPLLLEIEFIGNEQIKSEDLSESLRQIGLIKGQVVSESLLQRVEGEIKNAYQLIGYFNADVNVEKFPESRNRLMIRISIFENSQTKINSIQILGNNFFSQKKILSQLQLDSGGIFSFITDSNVYSAQKFDADLQKVKSFYLNRGFADFKIKNSSVNLSADQKKIDIVIEIDEGNQYKMGNSSFDLANQFSDLPQTIQYKDSDSFNYELIENTSEAIKKYLANFGYAFANVNPNINLDKDTLLANVHYGVFLGEKVYVNRINISGNSRTDDRVVRRELDLLEGSIFNKNKLETSIANLNRLGYFEDINIDFDRVLGSNNQVDLRVELTESLTGSYSFGVAYSDEAGASTNFGIKERNFLGAGYVVNADVSYSKSTQEFSIKVTDPFFTENRQSLSVGAFYSKYDASQVDNTSSYQMNRVGANIGYGIPLSEEENKRIILNLGYSQNDLTCSSLLANDDINGEKTQCEDYKNTKTYSVGIAWTQNTKDSFFFPTKGYETYLGFNFNIPSSTLNEYSFLNSGSYYYPTTFNNNEYVLKAGYLFNYIDNYQGKDVAFYNRYYLGGSNTLRGFSANTVGPKYQDGDMRGGTLKVSGNFSIISEVPLVEDSKQMRISSFIDYGNVYENLDSANLSDIRVSAGFSFTWLTAIGPLSFSWAKPIIKKSDDAIDYFQFSIGTSF